ncbi:MAG TPA: hypothetical protein VGD43_24570 [Micromonospora sp.]
MTVEWTARVGGLPIRADKVHRRDQVLLFGRLVEVADVQTVRDFPSTLNLVIVPLQGGSPRETLVPRDLLLMGMSLPRTVRVTCDRCSATTPANGDLAKVSPKRALCAMCADPMSETAAQLPAFGPAGRR